MTAAAEELLQVDPGTLVIGQNVRTDTHPDAASSPQHQPLKGTDHVSRN
jgi:hypothetical protein